mmetsp:Transcript_12014/g.21436  ORF Transcript_12014/g.21436 Transcript_12014/m.21436 type:complete len:277 (-) Transcript_12014:202-1032(-)
MPGVIDVAQEMGLAATAAVIVVNVTHPIDTYKTRLQVDDAFKLSTLVKEEGATALYKGISAAWMREATYTSLKLGLYGPIKSLYGADKPDAPFLLKFSAGSTAGVVGSVLGNPFDVLKTLQMTSKAKVQPLTTVVSDVFKERGIAGFYRGLQANMLRACVLNGTKMACYDQIKGYVVSATGWHRSDLRTQFASATGAGFMMTVTVSPFDRMRTLLMNQQNKVYSGFFDCLVKTVQKEGPLSLWRGFFPIWSRFAPQATGQLMAFELLRNLAGLKTI